MVRSIRPRRPGQSDLNFVQFAPFPPNPSAPTPTFAPTINHAYAPDHPISTANPPHHHPPPPGHLPLPPRGLDRRPQKQPYPTDLPVEDHPADRRLPRLPILPLPPDLGQHRSPGQPKTLR